MTTDVQTLGQTGLEMFSGSAKQVGGHLNNRAANNYVVVSIPKQSEIDQAVVYRSVRNLVSLIPSIVETREQNLWNAILDAIVPSAPPEPYLILLATMQAEARKAIIDSGDLMTAIQVAKVAQFSTSNPSQQPNRWKREGLIFAVRHGNVDYYPAYALDPDGGYRPLKAVARILKIFADKKDGWKLAFWFESANSFLGGKRPKELLIKQPEKVIAAAEDEMAGVGHG